MGAFAKKVLTRLCVTLALSGAYAWAEYKLYGDNSTVGIIKNVRKMHRNMYEKQKEKENVVLDPNEYSVE